MPIFMSDPLPVVNAGERHIPAVLAVDTSGSMGGAPIQELNQGLKEFGIALAEDSLALGRAEVSLITFNSDVQMVEGFRPASEYVAPTLTAGGFTSLNKAWTPPRSAKSSTASRASIGTAPRSSS